MRKQNPNFSNLNEKWARESRWGQGEHLQPSASYEDFATTFAFVAAFLVVGSYQPAQNFNYRIKGHASNFLEYKG